MDLMASSLLCDMVGMDKIACQTTKTEVENGSVVTAVGHGSANLVSVDKIPD